MLSRSFNPPAQRRRRRTSAQSWHSSSRDKAATLAWTAARRASAVPGYSGSSSNEPPGPSPGAQPGPSAMPQWSAGPSAWECELRTAPTAHVGRWVVPRDSAAATTTQWRGSGKTNRLTVMSTGGHTREGVALLEISENVCLGRGPPLDNWHDGCVCGQRAWMNGSFLQSLIHEPPLTRGGLPSDEPGCDLAPLDRSRRRQWFLNFLEAPGRPTAAFGGRPVVLAGSLGFEDGHVAVSRCFAKPLRLLHKGSLPGLRTDGRRGMRARIP